MRLELREEMVLDSPEVILRMVENSLGVAVLALTENVRSKLTLTCLPFGSPQLLRQMVLLEQYDRKRGQLSEVLARAIVNLKSGSLRT